jgi:hypothetical protein
VNGISVAQLVFAAVVMTVTVITAVVGAAWKLQSQMQRDKVELTKAINDLREYFGRQVSRIDSVIARHDEQLKGINPKLEDHEDRIRVLEQRPAIRSQNA